MSMSGRVSMRSLDSEAHALLQQLLQVLLLHESYALVLHLHVLLLHESYALLLCAAGVIALSSYIIVVCCGCYCNFMKLMNCCCVLEE